MLGNDKLKSAGNTSSIVQLVLVVLLIGAAFFIGVLWTRLQTIEGNPLGANAAKGANAADAAGAKGNPSQPEKQLGDIIPISSDDWVKGNRDAKIVLFEYSDYECPYCKRFHPTGEQMLEEYGDQAAWVYRHFPLDSIHPNARPLALAAECAGKLGGNDAFWVFTDAFMDENNTADSAELAQRAGLNLDALNSCVENKETEDLVEADLQGGLAAGITGTPGNVLMNTETGETSFVPGAVPFSMLKTSIDELLAN
ncbi:Sodium/proton antiporter [sediment metagenome]|uniref:Sodium/proton antiporter n=1 Tax=sediment metagenome TaxID=749907 RepID=D9PHK3_9ZZZZ